MGILFWFGVFFMREEEQGWRLREWLIWGLTHLMMIVVERADRTMPCHIAIITTCALFTFCCFSHPSLPMSRADRINYASLLSKHKIHGGFQLQRGTAAIISWWFYISSRWWGEKKSHVSHHHNMYLPVEPMTVRGLIPFATHPIHTCSLDTHTHRMLNDWIQRMMSNSHLRERKKDK